MPLVAVDLVVLHATLGEPVSVTMHPGDRKPAERRGRRGRKRRRSLRCDHASTSLLAKRVRRALQHQTLQAWAARVRHATGSRPSSTQETSRRAHGCVLESCARPVECTMQIWLQPGAASVQSASAAWAHAFLLSCLGASPPGFRSRSAANGRRKPKPSTGSAFKVFRRGKSNMWLSLWTCLPVRAGGRSCPMSGCESVVFGDVGRTGRREASARFAVSRACGKARRG